MPEASNGEEPLNTPASKPLLDLERAGGDVVAGSPAMRAGCLAVMGLNRWRSLRTKRHELLGWIFSRLFDGQLHGLVPALVTGDADKLDGGGRLDRIRSHLSETVAGCKELLEEGKQHVKSQGTVELNQALAGHIDLGKDELLWAYNALVAHALKLEVKISAPVCYNQDLRRGLTRFGMDFQNDISSVAMESRHTRGYFDLTSVTLSGAQLLHLAIDRDAERLRAGQAAEYTRRLLEAHADVNVPAYYDTEAPDPRSPGRRLQVAVAAIHLAVDRESVELVALLLQHGASPESRAVFDMRADYTPLHLAAKKGLEGIAKLLIEAGANAAETDLSGSCCYDVVAPSVRLPPPNSWTRIADEDEPLAEMGRSGTYQGLRSLTASSTSTSLRKNSSRLTSSSSQESSVGSVVFGRCAESLLVLWRSTEPTMAPRGEELRREIANASGGGCVNKVYDQPLPEGRFYKRSKELLRGCLIHYAVDMAARLEAEGQDRPEAIVRLVLQASADVHARAHYKTWGISHTCTALHIAAAGGAPVVLALLLDAGASVEAMVTNDTKPHYTPLLDAASEGHYEACELLLARRANPNVPNRLGRTCLHNAVLDGRGALACLLTEHGSDVTLADSIFQETPLLCTIRAKEQYPISDMLALCRAYHSSRCSLLHDLSSLASCRDKLAVKLLDFVLSSAGKSESAALKQKKEQMLGRIRRMAVEGKPDENGVTPVDQIATIIENAPVAGVRILADILMSTPDVQDATHGTLPVYANLRTDQSSWVPWRRWCGIVEPLLADYEPDVRRRGKDGREWPCWLFDSTRPNAEPAWHKHFRSTTSTGHDIGNHMVQMKVLLLANVVNAKMLNALACSQHLEIFGALPVRALLSFVYLHLVRNVVLFEQIMECTVLMALVVWARFKGDDGGTVHSMCWTTCAAVSVQDVVLFSWKMRSHLKNNWNIPAFFNGFENSIGLFIQICHLSLLGYCSTGSHSLGEEHGDAKRAVPVRALLGMVIILRCFKLIMLFRYGDMFGEGILAVYNALRGVITMLTIMAASFFAFAMAFYVMDQGSDGSGGILLVTMYRGLMLGDDDSVDDMSSVWGGEIGNGLMVAGTGVFSVYLLNIMIAVLTAEYDKADRNAPLILWRERAAKSAQAFLGPVFPWCKNDVFSLPAAASGLTPSTGAARALCAAQDAEASCVLKTRRLGDLLVSSLVGLALVLFFMPVHSICCAVALGLALVTVRARLLREQSWGAQRRGKRFYLWVCHRADYSALNFVTEQVEKEHIDQLSEKVDRMEDLLKDVHKRLAKMSSLPQADGRITPVGRFGNSSAQER